MTKKHFHPCSFATVDVTKLGECEVPGVVIEVLGGIVQNVYSDVPDLCVILVDYDDIKEGGSPGELGVNPTSQMGKETRAWAKKVLRGGGKP